MVQNRTSDAFKKRLSSLPKGKFRGRDFLEIGGNAPELQEDVYEVQSTMTNTGDKLIFDFSGTSKQSGGFVNCGIGGLRASALTSFAEPLAWDLHWNAGILANLDIITQEGTLNNPLPPAAVSDGIGEASIITLSAAQRAVVQMILLDEELRNHSFGSSGVAFLGNTMGGLDREGKQWGLLLMDTVSGLPYGANASRDGIDMAGTPGIPYSLMANVETNEFHYPFLFLFRRIAKDGSGPGKNRGGAGIELLMTLHDNMFMLLILWTHGFEFPNTQGGSGGLPGCCAMAKLAPWSSKSDLQEIMARGELPQDIDAFNPKNLVAKSDQFLGMGDLLYLSPESSAGYGDPIKREPERVLNDVLKNLTTNETALKFYGVVIEGDPPVVNEKATEKERKRIIEKRLSEGRRPEDWGELVPRDLQTSSVQTEKGDKKKKGKASGRTLLTMGMGLRVIKKKNGDIVWACHDCLHEYCPVNENPKLESKMIVGRLNDLAGPRAASTRLEEPRFFYRQFYCPECGLMWDGEMARATDSIIQNVELDNDYIESL